MFLKSTEDYDIGFLFAALRAVAKWPTREPYTISEIRALQGPADRMSIGQYHIAIGTLHSQYAFKVKLSEDALAWGIFYPVRSPLGYMFVKTTVVY